MGHQVFSKNRFKIYKSFNGYVVHNSSKPFEIGHTHIENFDTAKYLVYLSDRRIVPDKLQRYLMISLIRLSNSVDYTNKLELKLKH